MSILKLKESSCKLFSDLTKKLSALEDDFYFRGMASKDWHLKTSIDRFIEKIRKTNPEEVGHSNCRPPGQVCCRIALLSETNQNTFAEFKAQINFVKNQSQNLNRLFGRSTNDEFKLDDDTFLHLPVILQHYGYPTRIQDWTESWEIALYFCLENETKSRDFCIWVLRKSKIPDVEKCLSDNKFLYPATMSKENRIHSFYNRLIPGVYNLKKRFFSRIEAQKGITLVTGRADYMDFQKHLTESNWVNDDDLEKIVIDESLRTEIKLYLDFKGINKTILYPKDITDGYIDSDIKSIEEFTNNMYIN